MSSESILACSASPIWGLSLGPLATLVAILSWTGLNWSADIVAWELPRLPACAIPRSRPQIIIFPTALTIAPGLTSPRINKSPALSRYSPDLTVPWWKLVFDMFESLLFPFKVLCESSSKIKWDL